LIKKKSFHKKTQILQTDCFALLIKEKGKKCYYMNSCFGCEDGLIVFGFFQSLILADLALYFAENKYFGDC
jgi:hypothetical protein